MPAYPKLKEKLGAARKELGLSQEEFAAQTGIKLTTLQKWENGASAPRFKELGKLLKGLGSRGRFLFEAMGLTNGELAEIVGVSKLKPVPKGRTPEGTVAKTLEALGGKHNAVTPSTRRRLVEEQTRKVTRAIEEIYEIGVIGLADTSGLLESIASQLQAEARTRLEASETRTAKAASDSAQSVSRLAKSDKIASASKQDS